MTLTQPRLIQAGFRGSAARRRWATADDSLFEPYAEVPGLRDAEAAGKIAAALAYRGPLLPCDRHAVVGCAVCSGASSPGR